MDPSRKSRQHRTDAHPVLCALAVALVTVLVESCSSGPEPPPTPEAAVMAFARALNRARFDEAYALMSSDYRKRVSFEQWKRRLTENQQETLDVSNALSGVRTHAEQRAVIQYDDGAQLELRREGDRWY